MTIDSGVSTGLPEKAELKERDILVAQRGRERLRHDLLAVEPDLDKAFIGIARPDHVDGEVVPAAGRQFPLPVQCSLYGTRVLYLMSSPLASNAINWVQLLRVSK